MEKRLMPIPEYLRRLFSRMKQRCYNQDNPDYKYYGGRGIKVCFDHAVEFIIYVIDDLKVDPRGLTIDRIDNDGNYEPGNIRFVTQAENNKNRHKIKIKPKLTDKQIQAYKLCSGEFEGLPTVDAAVRMKITPQAVNRLLKRAEEKCPELFPLLTGQEVNVKALLVAGWANTDIANKLQVGLSRVSQIIGSIYEKSGTTCVRPIQIIRYETWMDSQIRRKF